MATASADVRPVESPPGSNSNVLCVQVEPAKAVTGQAGSGMLAVGVALWDDADQSLNVASTITSSTDLEWVIALLKAQVASSELSVVLTSRTTSPAIQEALAAPLSSDEPPTAVVLRKASSFAIDAALERVLSLTVLELETSGKTSGRDASKQLLAGLIDVANPLVVGSLGALVEFLAENHILSSRVQGESLRGGLVVSAIREFALDQILAIDTFTSESLDIMIPAARQRPSIPGKPATLFEHLDRTHSTLGRHTLRQWFLRPSTDRMLLSRRLDAIESVIRAARARPHDLRRLSSAFKGLDDLGSLCRTVAAAKAKPATWLRLARSLARVAEIARVAAALADGGSLTLNRGGPSAFGHEPSTEPDTSEPAPKDEADSFLTSTAAAIRDSDALSAASQLLDSVLDLQAISKDDEADIRAGHPLPIREGVDASLDEVRRVQSLLPAMLDERATRLGDLYPGVSGVGIEFIPQLGYLVAFDKASMRPGTIPATFTFLFETQQALYFRSPETMELDSTIGDVHSLAREREEAVLRALEAAILEHRAELGLVSDMLGELDVVLALAEVAMDCGYCRPELVEDRILLIKQGRHPLAEMLSRESFVPNDFAAAPPSEAAGPVVVLTGPNGSGKSVILKQVALIAFMAHIGSFVPAERAIIGIIDRIFARVRSLESASSSQSSFSHDVSQMARMMRYATHRSLLLIDEFGKGTASIDGAALLSACVRSLVHRDHRLVLEHGSSAPPERLHDESCVPRTILVTHLREVLDHTWLAAGIDAREAGPRLVRPDDSSPWLEHVQRCLRFFQLRVVLPTTSESADQDACVPIFQLAPGRADGSYGLACARSAHIPEGVLSRAARVRRLLLPNIDPVPGLLPTGSAPIALAFLRSLREAAPRHVVEQLGRELLARLDRA